MEVLVRMVEGELREGSDVGPRDLPFSGSSRDAE